MAVGYSSNAAFYNISNGKICRQFKEPTSSSKERVTKTGKTVHEEFYDYMDGRIVGIETKDSDYGRSWLVTLQDDDGKYVLQMPYSSGYSAAFLKTLPNIDLSTSVKLIPKLTIEGDKKKTTLFVNQHGKALKFAFTKENPNGLPELKQIKVKGKLTYDDSEIMEFLEAMVVEQIIPQLNKNGKKVPVTIHDAVDVEGDNEPLPF
jgi:hypothetical protein